MKKMFQALLGALIVLWCMASQSRADNYIIRYSLDNTPGSLEAFQVETFKKLIEEKSGNTVSVDIFYSGQLGEGTNLAEQVQMGGCEMLLIAGSSVASIIPEVGIFNIPFLQPGDMERAYKVTSNGSMRTYADELFHKKGMKLLDFIPSSMPDWSGNKILKTPEDFKGFKMRVLPSPILQAQFDAYGAAPTMVAYSELYSGLQLGVCDGQTNSVSTMVTQKLYEVQSCVTRPRADIFTSCVIANPVWWDSLPKEVQSLIEECVAGQAAAQIDNFTAMDRKGEEELIKRGLKIYYLTDEEREVFRSLAEKKVTAVYISQTGDSGSKMLDLYKEDLAASQE